MKDFLKIIVLIGIIIAAASSCIWFGLGSPTFLSHKTKCDNKGLPIKSTEKIDAFRQKVFGFECQS